MLKVMIARVTTGLACELEAVFSKFNSLVSQVKGNVLSTSYSSKTGDEGFTSILAFDDPRQAEKLFLHKIANTEIRIIDPDILSGEHSTLYVNEEVASADSVLKKLS